MAVLRGIGSTIMENPMDIASPLMAIAVPMMAVLGGIQMIPTLLQKGLEGGHFSRLGSRVGVGVFGPSNTQAGAVLSKSFQDNIQRSIRKNEPFLNRQGMYVVETKAEERYTRLKPSNFGKMLEIHNKELSTAVKNFAERFNMDTKIAAFSDASKRVNAIGIPFDGGTPTKQVDDIVKKINDSLNPRELEAQKAYANHLINSANGDEAKALMKDTMGNMRKSQIMQAVKSIEDENYVAGNGRRLLPGDEKKIQRLVNTSS